MIQNNFTFPENLSGFNIHFVGIKGTGMAALVEICATRGAVITGSDVPEHFYTDDILSKLKIKPYTTFSSENITDKIQLVIYSSAYKLDKNPDLIEATKRNLPVILYSEALGAISATSFSCGIAGVHGKTTTTGLTGTILKELNLPAQVLAGSVISSFNDNSKDGSCTWTGGHDYFVAETCEYQRHFMAFHPQKIILTSVESDHQDFYPTFKDIQNAFIDYICLLPKGGQLIYCADDVGATETACLAALKRDDIILTPYGESARDVAGEVTPFTICFGNVKDGKQYFSLAGFNTWFCLSVPGKHNVRNASAAIALTISLLCEHYKVKSIEELPENILCDSLTKIEKALKKFCGSKRRSEIVGKTKNPDVVFIDDYGHHPTAIKTTLEGFKNFYPDRILIVDFMSHTYSRTAALIDEFASSFNSADEVILHKIYGSARETMGNVSASGKTLDEELFEKTRQHHNNVHYEKEILDALPYVTERLDKPLPSNKKGYLFVTMGAGDNWKIGAAALKYLEENK